MNYYPNFQNNQNNPNYQMNYPMGNPINQINRDVFQDANAWSTTDKLVLVLGIVFGCILVYVLLYLYTDILKPDPVIVMNPPRAEQNIKHMGCEATPINLKCEPGQKIKSGKVKFGRWDNSICLGPGVTPSTPEKATYYNFLPLKCIDKESCNINIRLDNEGNINDFGSGPLNDPYPGVTKHYEVEYRCQ